MDTTAEVQKRIDECRATQATRLDLSGLALTTVPDSVFTLTQLIQLTLGRAYDPDHLAKQNRITELPVAIGRLKNLTYLNLSDNLLSTLPDAVTRLQKLTNLNLSNNRLNTLPDIITYLRHLRELNLSNNLLSTLPDDLTRLQKLTNLNLSNNRLNTLPDIITHLRHLRELNLSDNLLSTLPDSVTRLQKLTNLELNNIRLDTLPDIITRLQNLNSLGLSNNQLSTLPDAVAHLQNLRELRLYNNRLNTLPDIITRLQNLNSLGLNNNQLSTLPNTLTRLQNLNSLGLGSNQLSTLPDSITHLQNLSILDLSNNQLSTLPDTITRLEKLTYLDLSNNQLRTFPDAIIHLQDLHWVDLHSNQLSTLPKTITRLKKLTYLDLHNNQLNTLPDTIIQLQNLDILDLSDNQLSRLPDTITRLEKLNFLGLSNNQLNTLPDTISRLERLRSMNLSDNQLSTLPDTITCLHQLRNLDIGNNPLLNPPLEVATRGIEAVRTYFAKFGEIDHLYEAKLLLVGEGQVGKSSLKKALTQPDFQLVVGEKSTEGIDVQRWLLPGSELELGKDFRLNLWDFGGQEIYHATHQFFLTRRSLYLLVTESRKEDQRENFYYWLNIIRLLGAHSPVILVLNKIDERRKELPYSQLQQAFPNLVDYVEVSCAPGWGNTIAALKDAIRRVLRDAQRMNHVNSPLPAAWVKIREALEQLHSEQHKVHISNDEYLALCAAQGLDETIANVLSDYLHDLGVFLHFRESIALCDTIFLDHTWVTDAVYKVLDDAQVKANYGAFSERELLHLWQDNAYRAKRAELLALMEQFEVCYRLPTGGYLSPQLLPLQEPSSLVDIWQEDTDSLRFEYRYGFMPKGILPRFIVREHKYIYQQTHWRYGVVLERGNTRALIRDHYYEAQKKITIILISDTKGSGDKKAFLEIIRKSIQEIHDSFHNLAVEEWVPCNCSKCRQSQQPEFFKLERLNTYQRGGRYTIPCDRSLQDVNIQLLLNDVFLPPPREREEEERWRDLHVHVERGDYIAGDKEVKGDQIGGDKVGGDQIATTIGDGAQNIAVGKNIEETILAHHPTPAPKPTVNNAWINGSFYLVAAAVLLALVAIISKQVAWYALPIVLVAGLLFIGVVGALQLRNNQLLSEKGFLALLVETYKQLPLLRHRA